MNLLRNPDVEIVFGKYPEKVRPKMMRLRQLILDTAKEIDEVNQLEETLRWSEPSYKTKIGSTLRIDWKESNSDQYAIYFTCTTNLVDTFKRLYRDKFQFDGNRAIIFSLTDDIPEIELKNCIKLALTYHKVKHLPFLGV